MKVLRFNQDASCFSAVIRPHSMTIFNCDPFGRCFELENSNSSSTTSFQKNEGNKAYDDNSGNFVTEMLFSTSLIAVVNKDQGIQKSKKLRIVNTRRKTTICELTFPHEIVDVVINRKRMCVLLSSEQIFVYDISCMKLLKTINVLEYKLKMEGNLYGSSSGSSNRHHISKSSNMVKIALCSDDKSILCYTAYCKSSKQSYTHNDIVIYDTLNATPINYLNTVHRGNIACMCISNDGKLVATASEKGTIIRLFSTELNQMTKSSNALIYEFRRGTKPSLIYEMKIDQARKYLACVGESDTIHVFDLERYGQQYYTQLNEIPNTPLQGTKFNSEGARRIADFISKKVISRISNHSIERDFAHIKTSDSVRHCIGFPSEFSDRIYVASDNGEFSVWNIPQQGGECILVKKGKI